MAKQYSNFTDIVDFSRASTATYRASNGYVMSAAVDAARIDYDIDGVLQGILLEPQRTNLFEYSNDASSWSANTGIVIFSNASDSPSGSTDADILADSGLTGAHYLQSAYTTTDTSLDHCYSVFVKSGDIDRIQLKSLTSFSAVSEASFYLSNGVSYYNRATGNSSIINTGAISYTNGWKRIWFSFEPETVDLGGILALQVFLVNSSNSYTYTGTSNNAVSFWGAQLEPGRYPSSLIYTDGAQATRALDSLSIPVEAFRYSSNSGTVVLEVSNSDYQRYNNRLISIGNNSSEGLDLWYTPASQITVYNDQDNVRITDYVEADRNEYHRVAMSYSANSNVGGLAVNGNTYAFSSNVPSIPSVSSIRINHEGTSDTSGITHIKTLNYYPRALSLEYIGELTR